MEKPEFIEAGEIVNTHGVRGQVKMQSWLDSPELLRSFKTLYIGQGRAPMHLLESFVHKGCVIAALEGVEDVNTAMALKGKRVYICRADAQLPEGSFFLADILGARVVTEDGTELGVLADVLDLPGNRVYVVRGEQEHMIPAVPEFIRNTDVDGGVITVHLIEGM
ncbi:MAG: ribosome maturation factor RimM [Oscillospiraceae bacterium]|nr:ribosome maturation factor RimM [Oscillospiraceae bacterium]MCD8388881.1 ribosome maturation factor RimM [Oscillospiraceae bacterium]